MSRPDPDEEAWKALDAWQAQVSNDPAHRIARDEASAPVHSNLELILHELRVANHYAHIIAHPSPLTRDTTDIDLCYICRERRASHR
ncbi:MAG: hypothetical protein EPN91_02220 [Salinibacterium sp.]|nr:MAG: hypothetical protein EPN91_02220 [Salinibacterium sp.]